MKHIGIFGTSGFAREAADVAIANGFAPFFIARNDAEREAWAFDDEVILESELKRRRSTAYAIGIGENAVRQSVAARHGGLNFPALLHPSASFGHRQREHVEALSGVIVCAGVRFTNNIHVGQFSIFNLNATIGHDVIVGEWANLSPGANVSGNVEIGERCWIGTGATINQGTGVRRLVIGANTVIGSGSVVVRDCEPGSTYVGIPARKIA